MSHRTLLRFNSSTRTITCSRLFHTSRILFKDSKFPHEKLEQGHTSKKASGVKDTQAESAKAGFKRARGGDESGMDVASDSAQSKARSPSNGGNPEQIGFVEQVGGASSSSNKFDNGESQGGGDSRSEGRTAHGDEEAQAPGLLSSLKQAIGLNTNSGDVKQNRGGGSGVTGTGTFGDSGRKQGLHTSATAGYHRIVEKDAPSPADYMKTVAQDLVESRTTSARQHQRKHNLTHRHRELSKDLGQNGEAWERAVASKMTTVSTPKTLPGGHAPKSNNHVSGEWSSAGLGDKQYRNVGVEEEPYEPPADDEDSHSKHDARQKKLRYGGLAKDPELV